MTEPRQLPNALEPERSILSSMMQGEAAEHLDKAAAEGITKAHFYVPAHGVLYGILQDLRRDGLPIEIVSLGERLRELGMLEGIGGPSALIEIYRFSPTAAYFGHHLGIVKSRHLARVGIKCASVAIGELYGAAGQEEQILSRLAAGIADALKGISSDSEDYDAKELMRRFLDNVERSIEGKNNETIPTPWANLNSLLGGGLGIGEITFLAARPSMGKTAFALQLLTKAAEDGTQGQFISIESGADKIANRLAASKGAGDVSDLSKGNITRRDMEAIQKAVARVERLPIRVRKMHGPTAPQVASAIRTAARDHGARLIVIDYLQLIRSSSRSEQDNVRLRMDNALDTLCPLASELGICLVILAQLNRDAEGKLGKDLDLSMLKETGRIEQDADSILMIGTAHDHESDGEDTEPRVVKVPKNRDGPTSFARLQFHGPTTTFHQ